MYQKAVAVEKPGAEAITPREEAAKKHCPILNSSPLTFPGLPNKSFIPLSLFPYISAM